MTAAYLLAEGIRPGTSLDLGVQLTRVRRVVVREPAPDDPPVWTSIEFEFAETDADEIAARIADVLEPAGGWYTHFTAGGHCYVIYASRVFRYAVGDAAGRAEAAAYGRSMGVPERQLDWDE